MKYILFFVLICCSSSSILSQEKWGSYDGSIAGIHYTVVEACGDSTELSTGYWYENIHITSWGSTIEGAGRKVIGDSVFFKYSLLDNSAPFLLYDYSVEVGDTINGNWGEFIVTEVDSEFAIGEERKRITMESTFDGHIDIWLSGLGSKIAGYLQPGSPLFAPDAGSEFSCYLNENSGEYYYGDKDPSLCMIPSTGSACNTTSVDDTDLSEGILIYPNPTDGFITIEIDNKIDGRITTQLFSMNGKLMFNKAHKGNELIMDLSNLNSGIYLLKVSQSSKNSYHKIVIQ
jgi:hypothetical protein